MIKPFRVFTNGRDVYHAVYTDNEARTYQSYGWWEIESPLAEVGWPVVDDAPDCVGAQVTTTRVTRSRSRAGFWFALLLMAMSAFGLLALWNEMRGGIR